ncbi:ABC transporter ATP-binding protein [Lyngbya confervoides]|uniref:ABC transporter ATP-binding protein/permease n=1 Tax=Lyngbya confervoides BDU141951 TaxID=1574623 RepID=A0ABD4T3F9_9CYAN|nr:ABC transporter ATP-binding protein [Lyngbya confervoides]MCM1983282.1 ABC transporter ATP-binding protein/permease [Lyngbya confervoides BDU141951]
MTPSDSKQPSSLQKLLSYLKPHWKKVTLGIGALFIVNGISAYLPLLISGAIDQFQTSFEFSEVQQDVLVLLALSTLMWAIRMGSRVLLFGAGRQVEFDLKQRIFDHLLQLEPAYFAVNTPGDLINRATSDVDNIRRLVGFAVLSIANTAFAYVITLPLMLGIDPVLSLLSIAVYPFIMLVVKVFSQRLRDEQSAVQTSLSNLSDLIQEDMSGISLIKIYAQEENEHRAFGEFNHSLLQANLKLALTQNTLFPFLGGVASISLLVLLSLGSRAIASGTISVGDFVALLLYVERLIFPTAILGFTITAYQRGIVSLDRIEAILSVQPAISDKNAVVAANSLDLQGAIRAQDLSLRYPGADQEALKQVSFQIKPGQMVAIVGPVGSGKTTLANCIPRLLDVPPGQLWIDDYDVTQLPLEALRTAIAYVPQDSFLFSASIKNNIRYGDPVADLAAVQGAAQQAKIHEEILNFPKQYETPVGERGITLSGGQRQRSALARALMTDAPILILDDALASVDNQTATFILEQLAHTDRRKTVIFISHQLSAAAIADQILVMDHGKLVQSGTHRQLLQTPGLYRHLWSQQQLEAQLKG